MTFVTLVLLAGLGTYLMRYLPLVSGQHLARRRDAISLFLSALGLAAITALIVLSMADLWRQSPDASGALRLLTGAAGVLLALKLTRNVGLATLAGALVHGLIG